MSVLAEGVLPVGAAEEEGEAVQVSAERVQAVGEVAGVGQERWGERGGVGGEPSAGELQELGELDGAGGLGAGLISGGCGSGSLRGAGLGEAVGVGAGLDDAAAEGDAVHDGGAQTRVGESPGPAAEVLAGSVASVPTAMSRWDLPVPESRRYLAGVSPDCNWSFVWRGARPCASSGCTCAAGPLLTGSGRTLARAGARVRSYIRVGVTEGARLLTGGAEQPPALERGYFVRPTVFTGDNSMRIAQEEIFGPVLVIIPYSDEDNAIAIDKRLAVRTGRDHLVRRPSARP